MSTREIVVLICCVVQYGFSQREYSNDVFSITLPDGWVLMSNETADFLRHELNYKSRFTVRLPYDFILQKRTGDTLFSFPSIFIKNNPNGRLSLNELESFSSSLFSLDQQTQYLWGFRDTVIEVFIPTEEGTLNVFCYSTALDLKKNRERYSQLISSILINPALVYKKNAIRDIPILGHILYGRIYRERIVTIVIFTMILGFIFRKNKRRAEGNKT